MDEKEMSMKYCPFIRNNCITNGCIHYEFETVYIGQPHTDRKKVEYRGSCKLWVRRELYDT